MARKRPPQHAVDATPIYVPPDDDAWDTERIEREKAEAGDRGLEPDGHPVEAYWAGDTRYDLEAPVSWGGLVAAPREYLDDTKLPERWILRRLRPRDYARISETYDRGQRAEACYDACVVGIEGVENGPRLRGAKAGRLTERDMEHLHHGGLVRAVGLAILVASMPLGADEKKA